MRTLRPSCPQRVGFVTLLFASLASPAWSTPPTLQPSEVIEPPADPGPVSVPVFFGRDIARDGNTALISGVEGIGSGVAYFYVRSRSGKWSHRATLTVPDPTFTLQDVEIEGDTALLLATGGDLRGRLFVYRRAGTDWNFIQSIDEPADSPGGYGQYVLAFDGRTAVVTAPFGDGAAFVYTRNPDGTFDLTARLGDESPPGPTLLVFGTGAHVDGNTLMVGASGANGFRGGVYVYERLQDSWERVQILAASDGDPGDDFGASILIDGTTALIGAPIADRPEDEPPIRQGKAYVFVKRGQQWIEEQRILNPSNGSFAGIMALDGSRLAIAAHYVREDPQQFNGIANVFGYESRQGRWSLTAVLVGSEPSNNFALDLDLEGVTLLTGDGFLPTPNPLFDGQGYEFTLTTAPET